MIAEFRYMKAVLSDENSEYREGESAPAGVIEAEIERRGLAPDREDVIPGASSPGREENQPPL